MNHILKRSVTAVTMIALMIISVPGISDSRAQDTMKMVCHSGGTMSVIVSPSVNTTETWLQIRFIKSRFSLNNMKPRAGECTFVNRTVQSEEPDIIATHLKARVWTEFRAIGSGHANAGVVPNDMYKQDQEMAKKILHQARNEGYFTAEVYDTGEGYFEIVSISDGVK